MSYLFDRQLEYSVITHIKNVSPTDIPVLDDDLEEELTTSSIVVSCLRKIKRPFQHGDYEIDRYSWGIYIYANNKGERDYLTDAVYNSLEPSVKVIDFEDSDLGNLITQHITASYLTVPNNGVDKLRYRSFITFDTIFQEA